MKKTLSTGLLSLFFGLCSQEVFADDLEMIVVVGDSSCHISADLIQKTVPVIEGISLTSKTRIEISDPKTLWWEVLMPYIESAEANPKPSNYFLKLAHPGWENIQHNIIIGAGGIELLKISKPDVAGLRSLESKMGDQLGGRELVRQDIDTLLDVAATCL